MSLDLVTFGVIPKCRETKPCDKKWRISIKDAGMLTCSAADEGVTFTPGFEILICLTNTKASSIGNAF